MKWRDYDRFRESKENEIRKLYKQQQKIRLQISDIHMRIMKKCEWFDKNKIAPKELITQVCYRRYEEERQRAEEMEGVIYCKEFNK